MADTKKVLTYVGIGCGTLLLVVTASCVGLYYWGKGKLRQAAQEMGVDPSKGGSGVAGAFMVKSVEVMGPKVKAELPAAEQADFDRAITALKTRAGSFEQRDIQALGKALKAYTEATRDNATPGPEPARAFVKDLQALAARP